MKFIAQNYPLKENVLDVFLIRVETNASSRTFSLRCDIEICEGQAVIQEYSHWELDSSLSVLDAVEKVRENHCGGIFINDPMSKFEDAYEQMCREYATVSGCILLEKNEILDVIPQINNGHYIVVQKQN